MGCGGSRALPVAAGEDGVEGVLEGGSDAPTARAQSHGKHGQDVGDDVSAAAEAAGGDRDMELPAMAGAGRSRRLSRGAASGGVSVDGIVAVALKQKRKAGVVIFGESAMGGDASAGADKKVVDKDPAVAAIIRQALRDNVFFAEFGETELGDMVAAMDRMTVPANTVVIAQGAPGDNFYVVQSGRFEIVVNDQKVVEWGDGTKNRSFGELALLYNLPRAATVRSLTESTLWYIDRPTFRRIVAEASHAQQARLRAALKRGIFEDMADDALDRLTHAATFVKYRAGDTIVRKVRADRGLEGGGGGLGVSGDVCGHTWASIAPARFADCTPARRVHDAMAPCVKAVVRTRTLVSCPVTPVCRARRGRCSSSSRAGPSSAKTSLATKATTC